MKFKRNWTFCVLPGAFKNPSDLLPFSILELKNDDYHKNSPWATVLLFNSFMFRTYELQFYFFALCADCQCAAWPGSFKKGENVARNVPHTGTEAQLCWATQTKCHSSFALLDPIPPTAWMYLNAPDDNKLSIVKFIWKTLGVLSTYKMWILDINFEFFFFFFFRF